MNGRRARDAGGQRPRRRAIVVLGFSDGRADTLHPVCRARLAHAQGLAGTTDIVILSGWARVPGSRSEAALMAEAWTGAAAHIVVDEDARTTVENAANAIGDVLRLGAGEVVVVTSAWHARRAQVAFRWLLRGTGVRVRASSPPGRSLRATVRELGLWPVLVAQLRAQRRT